MKFLNTKKVTLIRNRNAGNDAASGMLYGASEIDINAHRI